MIRQNRPRLGQPALQRTSSRLSLAVFPVIFLIAGILSACQPKETVDSWQMVPPTLETTNSKGLRLSFRGGESTSTKFSEPVIFNETSSIRFAAEDRGLDLKVASECKNDGPERNGIRAVMNSAPASEHIATTKTSESVSILGLLPPIILSPRALKNQWLCSFKISVTNSHGSRSDRAFRDLKVLNARALVEAPNNATINAPNNTATAAASTAPTIVQRRLACPSWWTDKTSRLDADLALHELAHAARVYGTDSRPWERRPLCSVIETQRHGPLETTVINGTFQPSFNAPRFSWTREFLLPSGKYENLMNRPVLKWTIRNEESTPQTVFISAAEADLRMATRLYYNNVLSWTRPLRAQPVFTQTGGIESRTTAQGFYVRIGADGVASVVLHSGRGPYIVAMSEFGYPKGATHLMLSTKKPMTLESLANETDVASLATTSDADLDAQPRDLGHGGANVTILDTVVLAVSSNHSNLVETAMSKSEALAMGPSVDGAIVINMTPNEYYREILD